MKRVAIALLCAVSLAVSACPAHRSKAARYAFVKRNACPATGLFKLPCPGFIVDHVDAIECGGKDHWTNMQWQTIAEAKAKDKIERQGCKDGKRIPV